MMCRNINDKSLKLSRSVQRTHSVYNYLIDCQHSNRDTYISSMTLHPDQVPRFKTPEINVRPYVARSGEGITSVTRQVRKDNYVFNQTRHLQYHARSILHKNQFIVSTLVFLIRSKLELLPRIIQINLYFLANVIGK
jgi:hypothetical protein